MTAKEYRNKYRVLAEEVEKTGTVMTSAGPGFAYKGDFLCYGAHTFVMPREAFLEQYEEIKGDNEFHPGGKTVDEVVAFLAENPDEIDRIKQEERDGGSRKGILSYEV